MTTEKLMQEASKVLKDVGYEVYWEIRFHHEFARCIEVELNAKKTDLRDYQFFKFRARNLESAVMDCITDAADTLKLASLLVLV